MGQFVEKRSLTAEEMVMLNKVAGLDREGFDEQTKDFLSKSADKGWAKTWGLSAKQISWLGKLYATHFPAEAAMHTPAKSDDGLKGEFCAAQETPGGWQITLHGMVIGPFVSKGEAATIVTWLDKAVVNIEQLYGPPLQDPPVPEPDGSPADGTDAAAPAVGEEYTPAPGDPF